MYLAIILMFLGDASKEKWIVYTRSLQIILSLAFIDIPIPENYLYILCALNVIAFYDIMG